MASKMLRNWLKSAAALSFVCVGATQAFAGTSTGRVSVIGQNSVMMSFVGVGPISGKPACVYADQFAIDVTTQSGKAMLLILLSAQA